jgi:diguanylate cyclase (GGDEF)-like protein/PAS domain S-box-containing protein
LTLATVPIANLDDGRNRVKRISDLASHNAHKLRFYLVRDMSEYMAVKSDHTALLEAESALSETLERYRNLFDNSRDAVVITTPKGEFVDANRAAFELLGYTREELFEANAEIIYADAADRRRFIKEIEKGGFVRDYEVRLKRKDGETIDCLYTFTVRRHRDGTVMEYQGMIRDITDRKRLLEDLQALSLGDELTGMFNRRGFFYVGRQQLKTARRMNLGVLCLFIDVDGLKKINDTFGHPEGDRALMETARILRETFRESDIIGRLGGDEFAVLVIDDKDHGGDAVIHRLQERIQQSNGDWKRGYDISLSVGVYRYYPQSQETLDDLVRKSDALMYEEKKSKRPRPVTV